MDGSSLLTRGTRVCCRVALENTRFIPAYAGNSRVEVERTGLKPVHPRLRGELDLRFLVIMIVYGSSPLTRGTLHFFISDKLFRGSSPLTRGTQKSAIAAKWDQRFIPAYAGNSSHFQFPNRIWTVHPRLRGELSLASDGSPIGGGSSPLTRGTLKEHF